ncbi:MerR family transcriptional regulator [Anaeromassilibacillus senegalensis]|uniref:MerR family transcriptional regulator n=1 Tax=Anaeromassilibacillus senegalensis TaxID=1673717 RepID=A0ABS9CKY0_9FIRM|nr:MerR family transcriptional regulator [Anaeromassilibacillus senegalensis]MCF2651030.1 MerR family transcriptional regulator [Anaeromassilibacillus senegalensis]
MYTMKDVCKEIGISYETLRFYCNEGLIPNVKREKNNYRLFDERDVNWIRGLMCLKKCGMSLKDMKGYMALCLEGKKTIPERKKLLGVQRGYLLERMQELQDSIDFIDRKQAFFDDVLDGKIPYTSNLIDVDKESA